MFDFPPADSTSWPLYCTDTSYKRGKFGDCACELLQLRGANDMVQVPVCDENALTAEAMELQPADNMVHIPSRIDHQSILGFRVPDNAAVALQRRHREDFYDRCHYRSGLAVILAVAAQQVHLKDSVASLITGKLDTSDKTGFRRWPEAAVGFFQLACGELNPPPEAQHSSADVYKTRVLDVRHARFRGRCIRRRVLLRRPSMLPISELATCLSGSGAKRVSVLRDDNLNLPCRMPALLIAADLRIGRT